MPHQNLPGSHRSSPAPSAEDLCRTLRALLLQYSSLPLPGGVKTGRSLILFLSTMALRGKSPHPHKSNNTCRPRSSADLPCRETLPHFHLSASVLVCVLFHYRCNFHSYHNRSLHEKEFLSPLPKTGRSPHHQAPWYAHSRRCRHNKHGTYSGAFYHHPAAA